MPLGRFSLYTVLGCLPWTFALAGVGFAVGNSWRTVERYFRPVSLIFAAALVVAVTWWFVRRARQGRRDLEDREARAD
jgi:membrane protein DedA with SNARE-associated domain